MVTTRSSKPLRFRKLMKKDTSIDTGHGNSSVIFKCDSVLTLGSRLNRPTGRCICILAMALFASGAPAGAQNEESDASAQKSGAVSKGIDYFFNYLNMAGTAEASEFKPLTQKERTQLYLKTMVNPLGYMKAGASAGIDQWKDKPAEWEQGASGYGKRFANIAGQYSIQRTVTFTLASAFHEDNRYFNSGKNGIWPRTGYAVASGILARHDDGHRNVSISQLGGTAAGAFISRLWQPPSQSSAADGTISFGITMASNMGFSVVKEFLPDLGRLISKKHKTKSEH
jgi:hypothetical protein